MTQQFHAGQEVEILKSVTPSPYGNWRKARVLGDRPFGLQGYWVQFPDGTRAVFNAEHIRAVSPLDERFNRAPTTEADHRTMLAGDSAEEYPGLAEPDDDTSDPMGGVLP